MRRPEHSGRATLAIAALLFWGPLGAWGAQLVLAQRELAMRLAALPPRTMAAERYVVPRGPGADRADELVNAVAELGPTSPSCDDPVWNFPDVDHDLSDAKWNKAIDYLGRHRGDLEVAKAILGRGGSLAGEYCVSSKPSGWRSGLRMLASLYAIEQESLVRSGQRNAAWQSWFGARPLVRFLERLACVSRAASHIRWKSLVALEHLLNRQPVDAALLVRVRQTLEDETRLDGTRYRDEILHAAFEIDDRLTSRRYVPSITEIARSRSVRSHRQALDVLDLSREKRLSAFVAWERSLNETKPLISYDTESCSLGYAYEAEVMVRARHHFALCAIDLLMQYQRERRFPAVAPAQCRLDESGKPIEFSATDQGFTLTLAGGWDWPNHVAWTYEVPDASVPHVE